MLGYSFSCKPCLSFPIKGYPQTLPAFWLITTRLKAWYNTLQMPPYCPRGARQAHRGQNFFAHHSPTPNPCSPAVGSHGSSSGTTEFHQVSGKLAAEDWAEDQLPAAHPKHHHIKAFYTLQINQGQPPKWTLVQFKGWQNSVPMLHMPKNKHTLKSSAPPHTLHVCEDQQWD